MDRPEALDIRILEKAISPLKEEVKRIWGDRPSEISRVFRARWAQRPESKRKDPKLLGIEMQTLDLVLDPIMGAAIIVMEGNPNLKNRFLQDEHFWENLYGLIGGCFKALEKGEELNISKVKKVLEEVVS